MPPSIPPGTVLHYVFDEPTFIYNVKILAQDFDRKHRPCWKSGEMLGAWAARPLFCRWASKNKARTGETPALSASFQMF